MARLLLTFLVALNLTLICQGHYQYSYSTPAHLTFLNEPEHAGSHEVHKQKVEVAVTRIQQATYNSNSNSYSYSNHHHADNAETAALRSFAAASSVPTLSKPHSDAHTFAIPGLS